jgi:RNA polymerase sigma-70 factor (ECF subfamily)
LSDTDGDLLRRCRQGDQAAWQELVSRYTRRVFGVTYRFCGRVDEAEDLTQEVFVKVFRNLDRFQETDASFSTWLTTIARNQAIDHYRRRREERLRQFGDPAVLELIGSPDGGPLADVEREERIQVVRNGLRALPGDLREVLVLCDLQGAGYEEISRVLGIPLGTVKSRINRGRLELAKRLLARRKAGAV